MSVPRLTAVSYMVLGLVERSGAATPYHLKQVAAQSVGNFCSIQHAQLYTESERLAGASLLEEYWVDSGLLRR